MDTDQFIDNLRSTALNLIKDKDLQRILSTASLEELVTFFLDNGFELELIPPLGYKFTDKKEK